MRVLHLALLGAVLLQDCFGGVASSNQVDKNTSTDNIISESILKHRYQDYLFYHYDINQDGLSDYIISSNPKSEDVSSNHMTDLYIYLATTNSQYRFSVYGTNFSEDGGNLLSDILPRKDGRGFIISTIFPDRGYFAKDYYVTPTENGDTWVIDKYVTKGYVTIHQQDGVYTDQFYYCSHPQPKHISFTHDNAHLLSDIDYDESEKLVKCTIPLNYVVTSDKADILDDRFHQQSPSNYYIRGDKIQAIDQNDDWVKVSYKNDSKVGWVSKSHLTALR